MHTAMITIKPFSNTSSHLESTFCFLYANKNVMQPSMGLLFCTLNWDCFMCTIFSLSSNLVLTVKKLISQEDQTNYLHCYIWSMVKYN